MVLPQGTKRDPCKNALLHASGEFDDGNFRGRLLGLSVRNIWFQILCSAYHRDLYGDSADSRPWAKNPNNGLVGVNKPLAENAQNCHEDTEPEVLLMDDTAGPEGLGFVIIAVTEEDEDPSYDGN